MRVRFSTEQCVPERLKNWCARGILTPDPVITNDEFSHIDDVLYSALPFERVRCNSIAGGMSENTMRETSLNHPGNHANCRNCNLAGTAAHVRGNPRSKVANCGARRLSPKPIQLTMSFEFLELAPNARLTTLKRTWVAVRCKGPLRFGCFLAVNWQQATSGKRARKNACSRQADPTQA